MPKLSVVIPTTLNRAHNTIRVLMSLNKQTADHNYYEVICAMDGGGASSLEGLIAKYNIKLGYKLTCIDSPRTKVHSRLPHRNHTRNAGCKAAKGEYLWPLDCDMLVEENSIQAILDAIKEIERFNIIPVGVVCLKQIRGPLTNFPEMSLGGLFPASNPPSIQSLLNNHKTEWVFDAHEGAWDIRGPLLERVNTIKENFPFFPKWMWESIGKFDESYLGWGGNKQEFCHRLLGLTRWAWIDIFLVKRALLVHQPHSKLSANIDKSLLDRNKHAFITASERYLTGKDPKWISIIRKLQTDMMKHNVMPSRRSTSIVCSDNNTAKNVLNIIKELMPTIPYPMEIIGINDKDIWSRTITSPHASDTLLNHMSIKLSYGNNVAIISDKATEEQIRRTISNHEITQNTLFIDKVKYNASGGLMYRGLPEAHPALVELTSRISRPCSVSIPLNSPYLIRSWKPSLSSDILCKSLDTKNIPICVLGIITYNRVGMLNNTIKTLLSSIKKSDLTYRIIISDDHSSDGTIDYLNSLDRLYDNATIEILFNKNRGGVAIQCNRILDKVDDSPFSLGFLANDDLLFAPGWAEAYLDGVTRSGYDHFAFMDISLEKRIDSSWNGMPEEIITPGGAPLVRWRKLRLQGALVTFTQRVINVVGGFDSENFKMFSHEHVDYTTRCKRAGLAPGKPDWREGCFDILGSNHYVRLNLEDYKRSIDDKEMGSVIKDNERRFSRLCDLPSRIKIPIKTN